MTTKKQKVLIADTDQFIIRTLSSKLETDLIEIVSAATSWEAIEILSKDKFDLIIIDPVLPLFSGYEILDKIKRISKNNKTSIIILTNLKQESDLEEILKYDIADYVIKHNIELNSFVDSIKVLLWKKSFKLNASEKEKLITKIQVLTSQKDEQGVSKIKVLKCPKCEATLPPKTEFCPYCGTKIASEELIKQHY